MSKEKTSPIAYLEGVTENNGYKYIDRALIFHLRLPDGDPHMLTYAGLMESLEFAEKEKIIPELSANWWSRTGNIEGCICKKLEVPCPMHPFPIADVEEIHTGGLPWYKKNTADHIAICPLCIHSIQLKRFDKKRMNCQSPLSILFRNSNIFPDCGVVLDFTTKDHEKELSITLATLLQCLCIAEQQHIVPPFDSEWEKIAIPPVIRERAQTVDKDKIDV